MFDQEEKKRTVRPFDKYVKFKLPESISCVYYSIFYIKLSLLKNQAFYKNKKTKQILLCF